MLRTGTMARLTAGLTGLAVGIALLAVSLTAAAAPYGGSGTPGASALRLSAIAVAPTTITSQYSCDLSGYGSGIPAVTLSGKLTIPGSVVATQPLNITLETTASTALPAAVITALSGITEFAYAGSVTQKPAAEATSTATATPSVGSTATATPTTTASVTPSASVTTTPGASSSAVPLDGTAVAPTTLSAIPTATLNGAAVFGLTGTGIIVAPAATLTITPVKSSGALAAITCTTTDAARNVTVNVTPQTFGTTGPLYTCKETLLGISDTFFLHVDGSITSSGTRTVGKTQTVTYTTPTFGSASWVRGTTRVDYAGSLPVTGAQPGKISLNQPIDMSARELKLPGKLKLTKAGTDRIEVPAKFTLTMDVAQLGVTITLSCTINGSPPVGLSIAARAGSPGPTPSHSATSSPSATSTATPGGQPQGSAAPSGAPDTGGGLGPASTVPMALAGSVMAAGGAGLALTAVRRRRGRGA